MHEIKKLLVVDDSRVFRDLMMLILRPHCDVVIAASGHDEAIEAFAAHPDLSLAVCDVVLPDGDGFEVLRRLRATPESPEVILVTGRPTNADRARAHEMGALDYLTKPICFKDVAGAWKRRLESSWAPNPRVRRPTIGHALVVDPDVERSSLVRWEIEDVSLSGAFLATNGPMEPGSQLTLEFVLDDHRAVFPAVVTRVQEPSWAAPGGVAIRFESLNGDAQALLHEMHRRFGDCIS